MWHDKEDSWLNGEAGGNDAVKRTEKTRMADDKAIRDHLRDLDQLNRSKQTRYERELMLGRLRRALPVPLLEATPEHLYEWRAGLRVGPATAANYISHVQMFYRFCVKHGLIAKDPSRDIPVPALPKRLPRPISEVDLMAALGATDTKAAQIRIWLVLAAWCGLRAKEITLLRMENIRVNDVPPVLIIASDATKGRQERYIDLSPFVISELRAARLPSSGLAFPRRDGSPLRNWDVSRDCNEFLHSHGIADPHIHGVAHPQIFKGRKFQGFNHGLKRQDGACDLHNR